MCDKKHLIMGTAGHVDHGKTALVKALTGVDCDTHPEEKARGITINLGFAHVNVGENKIGIVDVPGHRDFVRTMVSGASGVDFALLVVAADSGVMPQTREHLEIMNVLGVKTGFVVINKVDLVSDEIVELAKEEIKELIKGSFLDGCRIVRASAATGSGIDDVTAEISRISKNIQGRERGKVFRMFIDRIFEVKGFGSVVNGSVISGSLKKEDKVHLIPSNSYHLRVRRLERDKIEVDEVTAGDRASMNLVGIELKEFQRGQVISDKVLPTTQMIDARIQLFQNSRKIGLWSNLLFHLGTYEGMARIHLLDKDQVKKGESVVAQIHLDRPCAIMRGDRFVIRSSSGDITLGGGEVIDSAPLHHKRRRTQLIQQIKKMSEGNIAEFIASEVKKEYGAISTEDIALNLNMPHEEILRNISSDLSDTLISYPHDGGAILVLKEEDDRLRNKLIKTLASYHQRNPLEAGGRTDQELLGILGLTKGGVEEIYLHHLCEKLQSAGNIKRINTTWVMSNHKVEIDPNHDRNIDAVEKMLKEYGLQTPLVSEMLLKANKLGIAEKDFKHVLKYLINSKRIYLIEGNYIHSSVVEKCRSILMSCLKEKPEGVTVAEFRDLVSGNRKICLLMLAIFDSEGLTRRHGDVRKLI